MKQIILDMLSGGGNQRGISSKRTMGSFGYIFLTLAIVVVMFVNPSFPGITEIVITHLLTSCSLLGLTTVENLRAKKDN